MSLRAEWHDDEMLEKQRHMLPGEPFPGHPVSECPLATKDDLHSEVPNASSEPRTFIQVGPNMSQSEFEQLLAHEEFLSWCDRASLDPHDPHTALAYERRITRGK